MTTTGEAHARRSPRRPVRDWWGARTRPQQWALLLPAVALVYALPVLNPPLLSTEPGYDFPIAMFECARYALLVIGLNVVVGQAGLLDLGYVGFFAVGAYVAALFTSPDSALSHLPFLAVLPLAMAKYKFNKNRTIYEIRPSRSTHSTLQISI